MSGEIFENLARHFGPAVNKHNTKCRHASSVKERLAITLRFPATGGAGSSVAIPTELRAGRSGDLIHQLNDRTEKSLLYTLH